MTLHHDHLFQKGNGEHPSAKASNRSLHSPGPRAFISCPRHPLGGARGQQHCTPTFSSDHDQPCLQKPFTLQGWDFSSMRGKKISNQGTPGSEAPPLRLRAPLPAHRDAWTSAGRVSITSLSLVRIQSHLFLKQRALQTKRDGKLKNHKDGRLRNIKV